MAQSLDVMAEELTCSICLSLFTTPVTLPCGHNFCSACLDLSWKGAELSSYSCPQCRYVFSSKPELRKNTLLSNLVSQVEAARGEEPNQQEEEEEEEPETPDKGALLCDSCRKVVASKTCLTCMASFCQEHLMPHLQSPAFLDHLLSHPLRDLQQRKCTEHNKLMDHYCWDHEQCLCCYCALGHKVCKTYPLQEAKRQKELHYTNLLRSVNQKMEKAMSTASEVEGEKRRLLESTRKKKEQLEAEYEDITSLINEERRRARAKVEEEEKKVTGKFTYTQNVLTKKKQEYERMSKRVQSLLQEQDDLQFLKKAAKLRDTTSKEPFKPKTEFNEKLLQNIFQNAVSLKETVKSRIGQLEKTPEWTSQPQEKAERSPPCVEPMGGSKGGRRSPPCTELMGGAKGGRRSPPCIEPMGGAKGGRRSPPCMEPMGGAKGERSGRSKHPTAPSPGKGEEHHSYKNVPKTNKAAKTSSESSAAPGAKPQRAPRSKSTANVPDPREQLLMYSEKLSADPSTVHKKIVLSELCTRLSVSDVLQNYQESPQRFVSCSQLLCSQGFSQGVHYWEVLKDGGNFSGLGVAYQRIARTGAESRLGRNKVSWCIEWCNGKLQAWHDDKQTDLTTPNTNKYGVLLNYDQGFVSFFCIGKKFSEIYKFRAKFTETVYPAFWMFSSKTVLVLNAFQTEATQSK